MGGILHRMVDRTLRIVDAIDDLVMEAALGFGAAAPMIVDREGDPSTVPPTRYEIGD